LNFEYNGKLILSERLDILWEVTDIFSLLVWIGLQQVQISGAHPLVILMADLDNAYKFWKVDTENGPAFVFGSVSS
jgi:hypothetical protein